MTRTAFEGYELARSQGVAHEVPETHSPALAPARGALVSPSYTQPAIARLAVSLRHQLPTAAGLIVVVTTVIGCAGHLVHIQEDRPPVLRADEGILIVDIDSNISFDWLRSEEIRIDRVLYGRTIRLYIAREGEYEWSTGMRNMGHVRNRYTFPSGEAWRFTVKAGHINYPGCLVFRDHFSSNSFEARALNLSSEIAWFLEDSWPQIMKTYPLYFSGFIRDDFLTEYQMAVVEHSKSDAETTPHEESASKGPGK